MRKYTTEFGLNVYSSFVKIISVSHLEKLENRDNHNYHIYGILLAPKYFLKNDSITKYEDHFSVILFSNYFDEYVEFNIDVVIGSDLNHKNIRIKSSHPYSILEISIEDDEWCKKHSFNKYLKLQTNELFDLYAVGLVSRLKYLVLYIGQAYGKYGERNALVRLSSHETLQKILIDVQRKYPQCEIKIMLLELGYNLGVGMATCSTLTQKSNTKEMEHLHKVLLSLPQEEQVINIAEAAMINYFKPEYNSRFVENFPSINHKSYRQYYDLDYNCLTIEIDLEFDNYPHIELFTDTASMKSVRDIIFYQLDNSEHRESMYSIFMSE